MPKQALTIGVTGGRTFTGYLTAQKALVKVSKVFDITVLYFENQLQGAGGMVKTWCDRTGTPCRPYQTGKDQPGLLLIFPGDETMGQFHAEQAGIPFKVIEAHPNDCPQRIQESAAEATT
jgi:hypothetical protein